ncbi:MAG: dienelactone hydrolase family protein [Pseudomonadota bacterium]
MAAAALVVLAATVGAVGLNTVRGPLGWSAADYAPAALATTLKPYYQSRVPDGPGPFPTALLFSGCDGPKDNLPFLAEELAEAGWASIIVDSHRPRQYEKYEAWRLVCSGQLLNGSERAGDVAVALDNARRMDFVDDAQIVMIGASHGGWAVLDFLTLVSQNRVPPILQTWPVSIQEAGLSGLQSVVVLYPYCGTLSMAGRDGWSVPVPAMFLLVEGDTITDFDDCLQLAERERGRGQPIEIGTFRGVTHGFDQVEKSLWSRLEFNPDARDAAVREILEFIDD